VTDETKKKIKRAIVTAIVAALLALGCKALPEDYRGPCQTVINICTGGF
jgi:hypothetical protein